MGTTEPESKDFIREIIDEDLHTNKYQGRVHTRFPPEPNGYLHIGHAKSICLNFGIAEEYRGLCNLRFDDTNPTKEEQEYVESIKNNVTWLGFNWEDRLFFASDYFDQMYDYAVQLVKQGQAYVDDLPPDIISEYRGTLTTPGKNSPYRERSIEENLQLLEAMKAGKCADGEKVLRAKIDMALPNLNMRDPIMYRVLHATHHNTKDKWCIYPMYDWAHGLEDSIEGITHSICTLEFENHRPLYDWFLDQLKVYHPQQIEFARLNLSYTIMSKRMLLQLVNDGYVNGWDDPRLPTISGMQRRGYSPESIRTFCKRIGVGKVNSTVDYEFLEHCVRDELNKSASRYMGVLNPLKVIITNYPDDQEEQLEAINNPENPSAGTRMIPFSKELYIEHDDFMEDPPKKFFRLTPGREVRFRYSYFITCEKVIKNGADIVELHCTYDPDTKGGYAPDGRKVKSTIHWVSAPHAIDAEVHLYDRLFNIPDPAGKKGHDFKEFLNEQSLEILKNCKVEPTIQTLKPFNRFQFERLGYFCIDPDTKPKHLVINRTVTLRDTWAKIIQQEKQSA
ncbi:MAG: glutamine--tRNA ligase/YqeY domain fusion protein [Candidatus Thermoplasmatota archaeon]|nr:glutamine--tRNA ligase/YqeY domain fusion protein [Candidatus Thermoplasmatota archaeon]MBU1940836.1 glutamine--tRNA ligase/YqeY domain fusion protein [Candidatus Thermoplasmatota archaeon]